MCSACEENCYCDCTGLTLIDAINKGTYTILIIAYCDECNHEVYIYYYPE